MDEYIYNPTLCLYFFKQFQEVGLPPREMLDDNLATDESKLEYIAQIPMGRDLLVNLTQKQHGAVVSQVSKRFGMKEMLEERSKDNSFLVSFLYYFGVLTLDSESDEGELILKVPNLVIQSLYVERVHKMFLPNLLTGTMVDLLENRCIRKEILSPCVILWKIVISLFLKTGLPMGQ